MNEERKEIRLPVAEVARRLGCSRQHVYNLINAGELQAVRLGARMGIRVEEKEIIKFLMLRSTPYEIFPAN
ncbi:helix-turn-helix domain-containing protein [Nitratidesulfovibrio liaohensis]|uniref:Helix-turn-helix domain-containing protein n=1 Tax=Nitratidesulfovibrio liaohensis TaxID=2604158 RepID=A0ABY9R201_9BACT|nr:helix-turn-helix domain-containing protein [Nitratidesulfovibrio liaohensis]WMW65781.1 helix-turn-helix domain-containing protein [Nitratidesulfovibrio liaohensis]